MLDARKLISCNHALDINNEPFKFVDSIPTQLDNMTDWPRGNDNIFPWMDSNVDNLFNKIFMEAVKHTAKPSYNSNFNKLLNILSSKPDKKNKKLLSQYFTPSDVALYTAYNLLKKYPVSNKYIIFDSGFGHGNLLIASGLVLALQYGLRDAVLLEKLHGCEIYAPAKERAISNIINSLRPYIPSLSDEFAASILRKNLIICNFHDYEFSHNYMYIIIANPPYNEAYSKKGNEWIKFMDKILACDNLQALAAILPVSVTCSDRDAGLRNRLTERFGHIMAFHHETRPQKLFSGVDQRISILICSQSDNNTDRIYETTGFLTHEAGKRQGIWEAKYSMIPYEYCQKCFPKTHIDDLDLMYKCMDPTPKIKDMKYGDDVDIWIHISGRNYLSAKYNEPAKQSSKWKKEHMPHERAQYIKEQFDNGNALRWWRIFGNGRDLSIRKFVNNFPASI